MDFLGGKPVRTGYHGAEGDARYPSPRRLRNALANTVDAAIMLGLMVGSAVLVVVYTRLLLDHPWGIAVFGIVLFVLNLLNLIVAPSLLGGSIGQLLTGLVQIRGADGARPGIRELGSAYFKNRAVFRVGGVHVEAPEFVVVRRQDTVVPGPRPVGAERSVGTYLEH